MRILHAFLCVKIKSSNNKKKAEWKPLICIIQLISVATQCQEWQPKDGIQSRLGFFIAPVFREPIWIINAHTYVTNHISVVKVLRVYFSKLNASQEYDAK